MTEAEVLVRREGAAGRITLNRPKALNALTHAMCLEIEAALRAWAEDDAVTLVLLDAVGEKAFCAGGDIAYMYRTGRAGDFDPGRAFWRDEYRLNALIDAYPKPFVAIMHGIVMGGGVGLSAHGSHRLVTDTTILAMPECGIGLIPDVGVTHILARAPGHLGEYVGLTGARLKAGEAIHAGFADAYLPSDQIEGVKARLSETGDPGAIDAFVAPPPASALRDAQGSIDVAFGAEDVQGIRARLATGGSDWHAETLTALDRGSPLSQLLTLWLVRESRAAPGVPEAVAREYAATSRLFEQGDFLEGVRAAIIDKDRSPTWMHPDIDAVPADVLAAHKVPVDGHSADIFRPS